MAIGDKERTKQIVEDIWEELENLEPLVRYALDNASVANTNDPLVLDNLRYSCEDVMESANKIERYLQEL